MSKFKIGQYIMLDFPTEYSNSRYVVLITNKSNDTYTVKTIEDNINRISIEHEYNSKIIDNVFTRDSEYLDKYKIIEQVNNTLEDILK
jgi:hypothetical protein